MHDDLGSSRSALIHVHVCSQCGRGFRREVFEGRMHSTGIFACPNCGTEGPLNIEIRELGEFEPDQNSRD